MMPSQRHGITDPSIANAGWITDPPEQAPDPLTTPVAEGCRTPLRALARHPGGVHQNPAQKTSIMCCRFPDETEERTLLLYQNPACNASYFGFVNTSRSFTTGVILNGVKNLASA
jgi:hypothetical protein